MSRSLVDGIDRVLHEPARLVLMGLLAVVDEADFVFLVDQIPGDLALGRWQ